MNFIAISSYIIHYIQRSEIVVCIPVHTSCGPLLLSIAGILRRLGMTQPAHLPHLVAPLRQRGDLNSQPYGQKSDALLITPLSPLTQVMINLLSAFKL